MNAYLEQILAKSGAVSLIVKGPRFLLGIFAIRSGKTRFMPNGFHCFDEKVYIYQQVVPTTEAMDYNAYWFICDRNG